MKKLFISQPMVDKTDNEIKAERQRIIERVKNVIKEDVEVIDSFMEGALFLANPLWFLGYSIQMLSKADILWSAKGWDKYRGCKAENYLAKEYNIGTIIEEDEDGDYVVVRKEDK